MCKITHKTPMNWNDVHYFVCLVNEQTLTAAAEKLNVQHTTVARRIAALERALNLRLFDRMGKRYTLTQEGQLLYAQASDIASNIHTLQRMASSQNVLQGTVTLSAPPVLANEMLSPYLSNFHRQYPDICLAIQGEVRRSNLSQREADLALRLHRPRENDLVVRRLGNIDYHFYAHAAYWRRQSDTRDWQWVAFQANTRLYQWFQHTQQQCQGRIVFSSNEFYLVKQAIEQRLGIGILPAFLARDNADLIAVNPLTAQARTIDTSSGTNTPSDDTTTDDAASRQFALYLVMHADLRQAPRVRAVVDWLCAVFADR